MENFGNVGNFGKTEINRVLSYDESYWLERISHNFLICSEVEVYQIFFSYLFLTDFHFQIPFLVLGGRYIPCQL